MNITNPMMAKLIANNEQIYNTRLKVSLNIDIYAVL